MSKNNLLSEKEEENLHGFTGDTKRFLRSGDFDSAIILVDELKRYILNLRKIKGKIKLCQNQNQL